MQALLALAPSVVVLVVVLGLRWSGLAAAGAAVVSTLLIWLSGVFTGVDASQATRALADAGVLTALVAAMTIPGILFVEATRSRKSPEAIGAVIATVGLSKARAAILIAVGVGVLVESLTGMGVSLLVTIPLLLRIAPRGQAIALGLVGMSLMPWGALSISAHVSAKLSGLPVEELALWVSRVSGPVAFFLPLLCLLVLGERRPSDIGVAVLAGATLALGAALASRFIGIEVAGVAGGLAVILLMLVLAESRNGLREALAAPGLRPYLWLLAAVVVQKLAVVPLEKAGLSPVLTTGRVSFALITSPGVALLVATALSAATAITPSVLATVARRVRHPVLGVALFMLAARLLVECGAIGALAMVLEGVGGAGSVVAVTVLGAISGFATGSGVTGSALFMPSAAAVGTAMGNLPLFAALQNGASGHAAMCALPVAAILLAALPTRAAGDDRTVMRTGLALAAWHTAVLIAAGLIQL